MMVNTIEKIANTCKAGHMEQIFEYDLNKWKAYCYCERCNSLYERPFTMEESERFIQELRTTMIV